LKARLATRVICVTPSQKLWFVRKARSYRFNTDLIDAMMDCYERANAVAEPQPPASQSQNGVAGTETLHASVEG
jgi:hypothetical protein